MEKNKKLKLIRLISLVVAFGLIFIPFVSTTDTMVYTSIFHAYLMCLKNVSVMFFISLILILGFIGVVVFAVLSYLDKFENKKIDLVLTIFLFQFPYFIIRNLVYSSGGFIVLALLLLVGSIAIIGINYYVIKFIEEK